MSYFLIKTYVILHWSAECDISSTWRRKLQKLMHVKESYAQLGKMVTLDGLYSTSCRLTRSKMRNFTNHKPLCGVCCLCLVPLVAVFACLVWILGHPLSISSCKWLMCDRRLSGLAPGEPVASNPHPRNRGASRLAMICDTQKTEPLRNSRNWNLLPLRSRNYLDTSNRNTQKPRTETTRTKSSKEPHHSKLGHKTNKQPRKKSCGLSQQSLPGGK